LAITSSCFSAEVHLSNFIPKEERQQAGILLMEDTTFKSGCAGFSIAYNDFLVDSLDHIPVFSIETGEDSLIKITCKPLH
jgi:hypothetical protein